MLVKFVINLLCTVTNQQYIIAIQYKYQSKHI